MAKIDVSTQKWAIADKRRQFVHSSQGLVMRTYREAYRIASKLSESEGCKFRLILGDMAGKRVYPRLWDDSEID